MTAAAHDAPLMGSAARESQGSTVFAVAAAIAVAIAGAVLQPRPSESVTPRVAAHDGSRPGETAKIVNLAPQDLAPADPVVAASLGEIRGLRPSPGVSDPVQARERVMTIARLGHYPSSEALTVLRTLAQAGHDRLERGAAMSALWERGDRDFLEGLPAMAADSEFAAAKLAALKKARR